MVWERVSGDKDGDVVAFNPSVAKPWLPPGTAPKDGSHILGYGRIRWSSFDFREDAKPVRAVVFWSQDEVDGDDPDLSRSGWRLVNANPYADHMDLEAWQKLPDPPAGP